MVNNKIIASFVHGYNDLELNIPDEERPSLMVNDNDNNTVYSYPFPRNPGDFEELGDLVLGSKPFNNSETFKKLPRFGLTGLSTAGEYIFGGSWNSVYKISKSNFKLEAIISNNLMSDLHGIWADENEVITILTCKDAIIISDHEGKIVDHFSVDNNLNVFKDPMIENYDWRFISKQHRGSTGNWHFNYVQKIGNEIWLTSRNANSFVVVDLVGRTTQMRLMNFNTPVLLHDGVKHGDRFYFTSIDGKIIIAEDYRTTTLKQHNRENLNNAHLFNRDLVTMPIRLSETGLGREPNWCRGIAVNSGIMYLTIDGRYDTDLSFGLLAMKEDSQEIVFNHRLKWSDIDNEKDLRFVTGFDVLVI